MQLSSHSLTNGAPIDRAFAAGDATGFAPDRNPHLAWNGAPEGTRSFLLVCVDPDVPTVAETVGRSDMTVPRDQPRCDFVHWVMADIPASVQEIAAAQIEPPPNFGARIRADFISGMAKVDGKFVIVLAVDKVLSIDEMSSLAEAGQAPSLDVDPR